MESERTNLVSYYFSFGIVFEVSVPLEATFNNFTEFRCECFVTEEVVHTQTRPRRFRGIGGANPLLRRADARHII